MHGRHEPTANTDSFQQDFRNRSQTIGGARGTGDNFVLCCQVAMIDAVHNCLVHILTRRGNQDGFCAGFQMRLNGFFRAENTRTFHDDINTHPAPINCRWVAVMAHRNAPPAIFDRTVTYFDIVAETTVHAVVTQKMSRCFDGTGGVDGDQFHVSDVIFDESPCDKTSNTAKAVNSDFYRHARPTS